ncbi:hypothetical protein CGLO_13751 [Colletotrichum gloeosporioides Cg-14]|uniref:Uncharacterized protein n=1 Tax=Colletotrichum gloeosporioides (strain Cg-14) TaxID=1237896 RepID=T0LFU7_COLGC|nr:hypothetical protein CGLO_13751 [Colletotrichum gloeosporioides Cg-14]
MYEDTPDDIDIQF